VSKKSRPRSKANPGWFAKGRSGNPKGRPTSSRASKGSAFEVLVEKTLTVDDKGGTREITVEEALQHRTYQDALAGKRMAVREASGNKTRRPSSRRFSVADAGRARA